MPLQDDVIREQIAVLPTKDRATLMNQWLKTYELPPFKGARKRTLIRGLAYHIQCQKLGELKPSVSRKLLKIAKNGLIVSEIKAGTSKSKPAPKTELGSQLLREWNGRTHTVHVTDKGYIMGGITYGSPSAVAKAITGAHWSGPRFFGVSS